MSQYEPQLLHKPYYVDESETLLIDDNINTQVIVVNSTTSALLTSEFFVDGMSIIGMIDTGASSVFIKRSIVELWCENGMHLNIEKLLSPIVVILGDTRTKPCEYRVNLNLDHDGQIYNTSAYVSDSLPFDLILGIKFLKKYNAQMNLLNGGCAITLDSNSSGNQTSTTTDAVIYLYEEVWVPPKCEMLVEVLSNTPFQKTAFVRNYERLVELTGIYTAKGIMNNDKTIKYVSIANMSKNTQVLPKGTIIGRLEFFDESEVSITMGCIQEELMNLNTREKPSPSSSDSQTENGLPEGLDLSNAQLEEDQLKQLQQLLYRYSNLFKSKQSGVPVAKFPSHLIDTEGQRPIHSAPYRAGPKERAVIEGQIQEMLDNNVIRPSRSPWSSPVVLVNKKDGSVRFCIDYRKLNKITKKDVYPLPRIDDCLSALGRARYFSTFDLVSGYWQIPMSVDDQEKTAFISHAGLFEFLKMPFGLTNAPATFQRYMDIALAGLKWTSCLVYLDDIIIFSVTFGEHLRDIEAVFKRIEEFNLGLKASKCYLCQKELLYLGHQITTEGIKPNPAKVKAIDALKPPQNRKELRRFLGMCSYYRKFIKHFADLASPLNSLNKDGVPFEWHQSQQESFDKLKMKLTSLELLRHPNFDLPFIIQTDASDASDATDARKPISYCHT